MLAPWLMESRGPFATGAYMLQTWNWVTGSPGHRVNGSFGSSFTFGSPGHWVIILTRVFPVFEKIAQYKDIKIYIFL